MHVMNTPQTTAGHRSSCHASLMCTRPWQGLGHDRDHWSVNSCWGRPLLGRWIGGVAPCCRSSPPCCKSGPALRGLHWRRQMHQIQSGTVPVCPLHSEDGALHGGEEGGEGREGWGWRKGRREGGEGGEGRVGRGRTGKGTVGTHSVSKNMFSTSTV